jgi:hypothetical protein
MEQYMRRSFPSDFERALRQMQIYDEEIDALLVAGKEP